MKAWKPLPENPPEREQFDRAVALFGGDVRAHIAQALSIWAAVHDGGSYADQCRIMANEVAKLALPAGVLSPSNDQQETQ